MGVDGGCDRRWRRYDGQHPPPRLELDVVDRRYVERICHRHVNAPPSELEWQEAVSADEVALDCGDRVCLGYQRCLGMRKTELDRKRPCDSFGSRRTEPHESLADALLTLTFGPERRVEQAGVDPLGVDEKVSKDSWAVGHHTRTCEARGVSMARRAAQ